MKLPTHQVLKKLSCICSPSDRIQTILYPIPAQFPTSVATFHRPSPVLVTIFPTLIDEIVSYLDADFPWIDLAFDPGVFMRADTSDLYVAIICANRVGIGEPNSASDWCSFFFRETGHKLIQKGKRINSSGKRTMGLEGVTTSLATNGCSLVWGNVV
ncbi:hypothetical protein L1987_78777 [Smallanthus sonchifolius]|uniref:Uncharacterized protein n=1 Tax=Smallanthus sonchifolius TaxID=185202 RepID=A0ACB8ZDB4_9ASTR|nr:hypothetical protein L1987_78777 [Smallanthus sonchifolius]